MAYQNQYDGLQRLMQIGQQNQAFTDNQWATQQQDQAAQKAAADAKAYEDSLNWQSSLEKGAAAGSAAGPWGTLIGGAIGAITGQVKAVGARMKHGQKWGTAIGNTVVDDPFGLTKKAESAVGIKNDGGHLVLGSGIGAGGLGALAGGLAGKAMQKSPQTTGSHFGNDVPLGGADYNQQSQTFGPDTSSMSHLTPAMGPDPIRQQYFSGPASGPAAAAPYPANPNQFAQPQQPMTPDELRRAIIMGKTV